MKWKKDQKPQFQYSKISINGKHKPSKRHLLMYVLHLSLADMKLTDHTWNSKKGEQSATGKN